MSLQLITGDTNSGKSSTLVLLMVERSIAERDERFFVIVPEQATLKMQKDVVRTHPEHAAMNIDVVSFDRLAHVVFSELGIDDSNVLDDIGKVLILRKVLKEHQDDLTVYKNKIHMTGFVDEIKSIITEFKQYGIDDNQLFLMQESAEEKGNNLLYHKLSDIRLVYEKFNETIKDTYRAAEEVLDIFARVAAQSEKIKGSHIYLDGFTGFTPIQYRLLTSMLKTAKDVTIALTLPQEQINADAQEYDLFHLSNQTYFRLKDCAGDAGTEALPDIYVQKEKGQPKVRTYAAFNPEAEVTFVAKEIQRLVREEEYRFRDIAVITGDMDSYYIPVRDVFEEAKISCFIDYKSPVTDNQLIRFLMGAVDLAENRLSYDAVFTYLKTYLTDLDKDEIAQLENYCLEFGIKGLKQFSEPFTKNSNWDLDEVNAIREKFFDGIRDFYFRTIEKDRTAKDFGKLLLALCEKNHIREQMDDVQKRLNEEGLLTLAKEYEQIYKRAEELLEKIALLMGEEPVTVKEYREVLESALKEIRIGIIPPSLDAVTFGDLTRTRLDKTKAVFLIGVNDGKIPAVASKTGLLSQKERELLRHDFEIAPTIEEDLYTQRFYLYLMLHKPQDVLYLTYASYTATGEELRPSYLLDELGDLLLSAQMESITSAPSISWEQESLHDLAGKLRIFAEPKTEELPEEDKDLLSYFAKADPDAVRRVIDGAFYSNRQTKLDPQVALDLYGGVLQGSVSRFENFNECAYKHFLNYGLRIEERPEYRIEASDLGSLYHDALDRYSRKLQDEGIRFRDISDEDSARITNESVDEALQSMGNDVLQSSKRYEFLTERIRQVTLKTTDVLRAQVRDGLFEPDLFEFPFQQDEGENTRFRGKIDRVDLYDAGDIFVKIIDYKSGKKEFSAQDIYSGLQLQLVAYMKAAVEQVQKDHPEKSVKPGGVYYYHIQDGFREEEKDADDKYKMSGLTSCEEGVVEAMDQTISPDGRKKSNIIPVTLTADGYGKASKIANNDEFWHLLNYVGTKLKDVSAKIRSGNVDIAPYRKNEQENGCKYCKFRDICRFEAGRFGTDWNNIEKPSAEDLDRALYGRVTPE